jgi:hypothetical protein
VFYSSSIHFAFGGFSMSLTLSAQSRLDDKTEAAKSAQKQLEQKSLELVDARTKLAASEASGTHLVVVERWVT